jgi:hypothetical protein
MDVASLIGTHIDDFKHALEGRTTLYQSGISMFDLLRTDMATGFFNRLVTTPDNPVAHRITGVFAEHLLGGNTFDGLMYPCTISTTLAMGFGAGNFALETEYVDKAIEFIERTLYRVVERTAHGYVVQRVE